MPGGLLQLYYYGQRNDYEKHIVACYMNAVDKEMCINEMTNIIDLHSILTYVNFHDVVLRQAFVSKYNDCKQYYDSNNGSQLYKYDYHNIMFDIYKYPFDKTGKQVELMTLKDMYKCKCSHIV